MNLTSFAAILLRWMGPVFLGLSMLAGCQVSVEREIPAPAGEPAALELAPLPSLPVEGSAHFVVDGKDSDVRILVYRGGPLAKVGHNHVLQVHDLSGDIYMAPQFHQSGFALSFPVEKLQVDPANERQDEGAEFAVMPSPQAIEATYKNMTGPAVLDAERFPEITLRSVSLVGPVWGPEATVRVTLHGAVRDITVPIAIQIQDNNLIVTGLVKLRTSEFGMTPFSVLGGGLQVLDEMKARFRIVAHRNIPD